VSTRELEVLRLLAEQLTNDEVAERLFISPKTVKRHVENIFDKFGVRTRRGAVAEARRLGLLPAG